MRLARTTTESLEKAERQDTAIHPSLLPFQTDNALMFLTKTEQTTHRRKTAAAGRFTVRELLRDLSSFNGRRKNFAYRVIDNKVCIAVIRSAGLLPE